MACGQTKPSTERTRRQAPDTRPQGVKKPQQPLRRSARLQKARPTNSLEPKAPRRSPHPEPKAVVPSDLPPEPIANPKPERKRKRPQEGEAPQGPSEKRPRPDTNGNRLPADNNIKDIIPPTGINNSRPPTDTNGDPPPADVNIDGNLPWTDTSGRRLLANINGNQPSPGLQNWLRGKSYPAEYFESGDRTWEEIKADTSARRPELNDMNRLLARKKSNASLRNQEADIEAPTEKTEDKSLPYRSPGYEQELKDQKNYLRDSPEGITDNNKRLCQRLLNTAQATPRDRLFRDNLFEQTCDKVKTRNKARVVEDISPLIAPSAETLTTYGATELQNLVFGVNEPWSKSIPVTKTRPQPDRYGAYSRDTFTEDQIQKLLPMIKNRVPINFRSFILATWRSFFPFFACEAKGGEGDLNVADKQNAHSMTMAVRGIVELFKEVNRENEVHRKLLAFSISHDAIHFRIYGHYATIKERVPSFWRHRIRTADFTANDGREKWTAYQFTGNVYSEFTPKLLKLICSAIDQLPLKVALPRLLSNPPQQIPLNDSVRTDTDLESDQPDSQEMATSAPESQNPLGLKKRRLTGNAVLERQLDRKDEKLERLRQEMNDLRQSANSGNDSEVVVMLRQELDRQRQDNEQLRQNTNSGNDSEVVVMLRQELDRQRQDNERQRQEMKEENEVLKEQISKLPETLMQALPAPSKQRGRR